MKAGDIIVDHPFMILDDDHVLHLPSGKVMKSSAVQMQRAFDRYAELKREAEANDGYITNDDGERVKIL